MDIRIFASNDLLAVTAADTILTLVKEKPNAVLCLATGDSPLQTYQHLVKLAAEQQVNFSGIHFVALDEWVDVPPTNPGSCHFFLHRHLFAPLGIAPGHIHLFDAFAADLPGACAAMDATIARLGGIDLMLVGIGMNGHIGFNEPGVSPTLRAHVIHLDEVTRTVGQKYFSEAVTLQAGITLGLQTVREAHRVFLLAHGEKKAAIIRKMMEEPVSTECPASFLRQYDHSVVFIDEAAASLLRRQP